MDSGQPQEILRISDLDTLRVAADPLRSQVLELLAEQPLTVKAIATRMGLTPSRLYYHVNQLESHGLIRVVETRMVANLQEKHYRATALSLQVDDALLTFSPAVAEEPVGQTLSSILDATRDDLLRSLQVSATARTEGTPWPDRQAMLNRATAQLTDAQAAEFVQRLIDLVAEFTTGAPPEGTPTTGYAFTVALYPRYHFADESPSDPGPA